MVDRALSRTQPETPVMKEKREATVKSWSAAAGGFSLPRIR